jgi:hypothetical protein
VLASQLRFKYPSIVDGALASAAPLNAISGLSPRTLFYREVTRVCLFYALLLVVLKFKKLRYLIVKHNVYH